MRLYQEIRASIARNAAVTAVAVLFASGIPLSAFGQAGQATLPPVPAAPQTPSPAVQRVQDSPSVASGMAVTIEETVRMALENNLGIQAERLNPQIQELTLERANGAYAPALVSSLSRSNSSAPPSSFLSSGTGVSIVSNGSFFTQAGVQQNVRWGGASYQVTWDGSRATTDAPRSSFSPQLQSDFTAIFNQPLLRNFRIDQLRSNIVQAHNQQVITDLALQQRITQTARNVRNAYYNLIGAIAGLQVAQQSLDVSNTQLQQNQKRVEVGTMAPIDITSAEAEVANNEEAVIIQQAAIGSAEDQLRTLVMNPSQSGFWTVTFKPTDEPILAPRVMDDAAVDAAVKNALANRTDIKQFLKQVDSADVNIKFAANQKLPEIDLQGKYGATALGGTQFNYPDISSLDYTTTQRSFGSVLSDLVNNDFRSWAFAVNVTYPLGMSQAAATFAQAKVQRSQLNTQLEDLKTQVTTQVRNAARNVQMNLRRVEADRKARELAEKRLDAENKRFDVGLSTTFEVIQAQRDLAAARQRELSATLDYNRSLVDFEAVQQVPLQ